MISMQLKDAKTLLEDVLHYEYTDSLLTKYKEKDSLQKVELKLKSDMVLYLDIKNNNLELINDNLNKIIENKNIELGYKDDTIKQQKKEIRKQKVQKVIGFTGSILLPIITLLLLI